MEKIERIRTLEIFKSIKEDTLEMISQKGKIVDDIKEYNNNNEVFKNQILNKYLKLT